MLRALVHHIINQESIEVTTLADIKAALDAQGDKLTALAERIQEQANSGAPDPAALQAIADELTAHNASIDALDVASVTPPAGTGTTPPAPPVAGPVITSIDPSVGPEAGGTSVTLTGTGYAVADSVSIGGNPATGIVVNNDTSITLVTPPGTGDVPIVVTDGAGNASAPATFRYAAAPAAPAA